MQRWLSHRYFRCPQSGAGQPISGFGVKGGVILGVRKDGNAPEAFIGDADALAGG